MRLVLAVAAASVIMAPPCQARVFARWRAGARSDSALESAGGRLIYASDVRINNGAGRLSVFGFEHPPERVMDDLGAAFGATLDRSGPNGGTATIRTDGLVIKLIVLRPERDGPTVVFKFVQSERDASASRDAPSDPDVGDVPVYPGAKVETVIANEDTAATLVTSSTTAMPLAVQAYYEASLRSAGWDAAMPTPAPSDGDSMRVYVRGTALCCVFVSRPERGTTTRITVLHKKHGVK